MQKIVKSLLNISSGILIFASGYATSSFVTKKKTKYAGNLRVDKSEPDEPPKMFLELTTDLNDIFKSKTVELRVINENYLKS